MFKSFKLVYFGCRHFGCFFFIFSHYGVFISLVLKMWMFAQLIFLTQYVLQEFLLLKTVTVIAIYRFIRHPEFGVPFAFRYSLFD